MTRLSLPVGDTLRDGFTEVDVQRVWRGIQGRHAAAAPSGRTRRWVVPVAVLAAAAMALLLFLPPRATRETGPLLLAGGGEPRILVAPATVPEYSVELTDGSRIVLAAGATLDVLSNEPRSFLTALRRGRSRFDVRPATNRRWVIECGLATVEVVGTAFTVDRHPDRVEVVVERGTVLVRGDRVPDRVQRLSAGERLLIEAPRAAAPPPTAAATATPPAPPSASSRDGAPTAPPRRAAGTADPIDDLVRRADAARARGDTALAAELLERVVGEAPPGDPRRALAALTLARLDGGRSPVRASRALDRALADAPPGLEEDVLARLVEARARAGDRGGARRAAIEYERRFPSGARLAEVRRWITE